MSRLSSHILISDTEELRRFCQTSRRALVLAIDTEFVWRKTYLPKLSLIQLCVEEGPAVAVDPLAKGIDLAPLADLLKDECVLKIFHAADNDVDLLRISTGATAKPIYDTQKAAAFCKMSHQCGYSALAKQALNVEIDKTQQTTDWSVRPLSKAQIDYALNDVIFLPQIYKWLSEKLAENGFGDWAKEEMSSVYRFNYAPDPWEQWRDVPISYPVPEDRGVLRELCAWRENAAKRLDIPRSWFIPDKVLAAIAKAAPKTLSELSNLTETGPRLVSKYGRRILSAVEKGSGKPIQASFTPTRKASDEDKEMIKDLKKLLRSTCDKAGLPPSLVATTAELHKLVLAEQPDVRCRSGWRNDFFGKVAIAFKNEHLSGRTEGDEDGISENGETFR